MATSPEQVKAAPLAKYDTLVQEQLRQASLRVRFLDLSTALLGMLGGLLAYAFFMIVLDSWQPLSPAIRLAGLAFFVLACMGLLGAFLVWPLLRSVNPYYVAQQLERSLPGSKNSLINWLDLHSRKLPAAFRGAVSKRAAKEAGRADLEQAISGKRLLWLFGSAGGLALALLVLLIFLGFGPLAHHLARAFMPFLETAAPTRTRLTLLEPRGGDMTVPVDHSVLFRVQVEGKVPEPGKADAPKLRFRYNATDPVWEERPLKRDEATGDWSHRLPSYEVHNGLWYHVTAGDARTPEYQILVRSAPLILGYQVTCRYRPYLHRADESNEDPNLKGPRGTQVTLLARTNRAVKSGKLQIEGEGEPIKGEPAPNQPDTVRFVLTLEKDGHYRLRFTSTENEDSGETLPYTIQVQRDAPPTVEITRPEQEKIELKANAVLNVEGKARDDHGLTALTLRMKVKDGRMLLGVRYRDGVSFRHPDLSFPRSLDYEEFVDLARIKDDAGQPFALRAGMELECWLEAGDDCDYPGPGPQIGRSKSFWVTIADPEKDLRKNEEARKQAQEARDRHAQEQDRKLAEEKKAAERQARDEQARQQGETPAERRQRQEQERLDELARDLQKEIEQQNRNPGQGKGDQQQGARGENKDENGKGPMDTLEQPRGEGKQEPDPKQGPGEGKDQGKSGAGSENGQAKGTPQPGQQPPDKGDAKAQPQAGAGAGENKTPQRPEQGMGESKQPAQPDQAAGQGKDPGRPDGAPDRSAGKGAGNGGGSPPNATPGSGKGEPGRVVKSEPKGMGQGPGAGGPAGDGKNAGQPGTGGAAAPGNGKPAGGEQTAAAGQRQGESKGQQRPITPDDVASLERNLRGEDPRRREQAMKDLQELSRNLRDPDLRQAAEDALRRAAPQPGGQAGQGDGQGPASATGQARAPGEGANPTGAGNPAAGDRRGEAAGGHGSDNRGGMTPDPRHASKPGDLQLQEFREKVTPEMLQKLKISPAEHQKFLDAYGKLLKEREKGRSEKLATPQPGGIGPNQGTRQVDPGRRDTGEPLSGTGRALPPRELQDAYKEFTEGLSKVKSPRDKK